MKGKYNVQLDDHIVILGVQSRDPKLEMKR